MRAYHLLSEKWGLTAIRNKRIKIARFHDLNDPFELLGANLKNSTERMAFRRWKLQVSRVYGLLCFSKSWKSPLLWSHYGQKHYGLCLGFDLPDDKVVTVAYEDARIEMGHETLTEAAIMRFLSTKSSEWSYEQEVRLITDLSEVNEQDQNYYADFNDQLALKEVIVGALSELSQEDLNAEFIRAGRDASEVKFLKARLAFKSFAVVPDKRGVRPKAPKHSMDVCCDRMAKDLSQTCEDHPDRAACPNAMIAPLRGGFGLYVRDSKDGYGNSVIEIAYCPWCGATLPSIGEVDLSELSPEGVR